VDGEAFASNLADDRPAPGSSGGFGNDNTFFWLFMTTLIPLIQGKGKAYCFWLRYDHEDRRLRLLTEGS